MNWLKDLLPPTTQRVALRTDPNINSRIRRKTIGYLDMYKDCSNSMLSSRIKTLNYEWDTERFLEANAAAMVLGSSILGLKFSRCWFVITGMLAYFLLQHALQGWCPPVSIIRKIGIRTAEEINNEKMVLKMMRKDFLFDYEGDGEELMKIVEK
ncbi:MAG: hypothetical protein CVV02_07250 [Firmicutes bacterium HGW-Firmicutes-7]|nr:MAG: hypothetical protein CVV02_07250 [Firmicutes bacterium HGW-Firmicutes-7]